MAAGQIAALIDDEALGPPLHTKSCLSILGDSSCRFVTAVIWLTRVVGTA